MLTQGTDFLLCLCQLLIYCWLIKSYADYCLFCSIITFMFSVRLFMKTNRLDYLLIYTLGGSRVLLEKLTSFN